MIRPGFYRGRLWHRRHQPAHDFSRDLLLACADVDEIDAAPGGVLGLAGRWPISLRRADHLADRPADHLSNRPADDLATPSVKPEGSRLPGLRSTVAEIVRRRSGRAPSGPMFLLSQPRCFGLTFDPVSFVYCMGSEGGEGIEAVVAEVTNTPWGEQVVYVLTDLESDATGALRCGVPKQMHVSPFFGMDHDYVFALRNPDERVQLSITNHRSGQRVFQAGFDVGHVAEFGASPSASILRHALMPYETFVGIYSQAARLAWKRAPFHPHPSRRRVLRHSDGPPLDPGGNS